MSDASDKYSASMMQEIADLDVRIGNLNSEITEKTAQRDALQQQRDETQELLDHTGTLPP
jgi:hypothetical protein